MFPSLPVLLMLFAPAAHALEPPESVARPYQPLSGMVVVLSAGHGKHMHISIDGHTKLTWDYQRKQRHGMREDLWTASFVADYLAPMLEGLGATVLALRERDRHDTSVVVDDGDADFHLTGGWAVPWATAHGGSHHVVVPQASATWIVTAPQDGRWFPYMRWVADKALDTTARVEVKTPTMQRTLEVDQTRHGGIWWPLGAVSLREGDPLTVTLHAGDAPVTADAIRLGGGTYEAAHPHTGRIDRVPYFHVAANHQLHLLGGPEQLLLDEHDEPLSDMRFRARWASYAVDPGDDAVYLSIHTNAGRGHGSTIYVGHDTDVTPPRPVRQGSRTLADVVSEHVASRLKAACPSWRHRGVWTGNLSEISPYWNDLDGILVELGFHDSRHDTKWLPRDDFQRAAAHAIAEGLAAWRAKRDAAPGPLDGRPE